MGRWAFQAGNSDKGGHEYIVVNRWRVVFTIISSWPSSVPTQSRYSIYVHWRKEGRQGKKKERLEQENCIYINEKVQ